MTPRRDAGLIAAVLVGIVLLAFAAPLIGGATFVGRDHLTHTVPAKQHIAESIAAGRIPEWWDAVDLGVPFAANPNHSALYPPSWIVAVLPMPWSADFLLVLHVLFSGLGSAALARRLGANVVGSIIAGSAFMLGGFTASTLVHGGPLLTLAWAPWIAWASDRIASASDARERVLRTAVLALLVGAELLAGDPSFAIVGGLLAFGLVACRAAKRLVALGAAALAHVMGVLLAAVVVLPALHLAADSSRAGGLGHDEAVAWSMHPLRILEWVWPDALGDPNQATVHLARAVADASWPLKLSPSWALSVYISLPIVILAIAAWRRGDRQLRLLAVVAAAFCVLALGRYTPLYGLYRLVFLPEHFVRYPEKYLAGMVVIVSASAGVGWTTLAKQSMGRRALAWTAGSVAVFAIAVVACRLGHAQLAAAIDVSSLEPPLDATASIMHSVARGVTAVAVVVAMLAAMHIARRRPVLLQLAAVVLVGHLIERSWALLPTFDRDVLAQAPLIVRPLAGTGYHRIARPTEHRTRPHDSIKARARTLYEGAAPNVATRFGLTYLVGYDQAHSARFHAWRNAITSAGERANDIYAVDHLLVPADEPGSRAVLATDAPYGPFALVANEGQRPRAFVAPRWQWFARDADLSGALFPPGTALADPALLATAHLLGTGTDGPASATPATPCELTTLSPEHTRLVCDSPSGGYAVLLDSWAPGWTATVDSIPTTIERSDALVRAVRVQPGRRVIEFHYATPGLRTGAFISALAWLLLLAGALVIRARGRRLLCRPASPTTSADGPRSP